MKNAAAYLRMSTEKQEHSIESQKRLVDSFAKRNSYQIVHYYEDAGISGRTAFKRPSFLQMIEDSSHGLFAFVLIYDSSRFARNLEQSLFYKSLLKKNGVTLISITEPTLDEDTSLITDALLGAMNEMYSRKLSKNVKRGLEQKALRGEFSAPAPYGYYYHRGHLKVNEAEAKVIRFLFQQASLGIPPYQIAKQLQEKKIQTAKGNFLESRRIQYILQNPAYKGFLRWGKGEKEWITKSNHPAIISPQLFDQLQETLKKNPTPLHSSSSHHLLSGFLKCSYCGNSFHYVKGYGKRKDRFRCNGQTKKCCRTPYSISVEKVSQIFDSTLENLFQKTTDAYSKNTISFSNTSFEKLQKALHRAKAAYLSGIDSLEEYQAVKETLLQEQKKWLQSENKISQENTFFVHNILELLKSNLSLSVKQAILHSFIEKILIDTRENLMTIYFFTS